MPIPAARVLAAYVAVLRSVADPPPDPRAQELAAAGRLPTAADSARAVLALLDPQLAEDDELCATVAVLVEEVARP
jgi:hypothetical protein